MDFWGEVGKEKEEGGKGARRREKNSFEYVI